MTENVEVHMEKIKTFNNKYKCVFCLIYFRNRRKKFCLIGANNNTKSIHQKSVHFSFFFKYVAFCTGFNLLTLIFILPYIIMDLPIFVIAEWATLLVDICCPRGGS